MTACNLPPQYVCIIVNIIITYLTFSACANTTLIDHCDDCCTDFDGWYRQVLLSPPKVSCNKAPVKGQCTNCILSDRRHISASVQSVNGLDVGNPYW